MKKRLLILLLLLLTLTARGALCEGEPALTLMVYLCGSNLETEAGAASADLAEMMDHYPTDGSLRILVMPAGSKAWQCDVATDETGIYELTGTGLTQRCTLPLRNMGDPATLMALLDYGYTQAPAQQYALVMWNHGAGPNIGLCFDERFDAENGMDGLTLAELTEALAHSPAASKKLAWIGFDACLMASVETACAIEPYAEYMIASQETEPASGWSYAFLDQLADDKSGADTGRRIINAYFDSLPDSLSALTLSCVDLRNMPAISQAMDQLFDGLHLRLDEESYPAFADCRVNSKSLGASTIYEYDLIDLVDLLQVYQAEGMAECGDLLAQLKQAIVASRSNTPYINGLSIYYPHYGGAELSGPAASTGYAAFIADMSALRLGKPLTDWSQTSRPTAALADGVTLVTMALTPEQASMLDSASLVILKEMSEDDYQLVYRTNDVTLTSDHVLTGAYEGQALFIVDADGQAVSEALPYSLQGDAVVLAGRLTRNNDDILSAGLWDVFVNCYFRQDETGRYRLAEIREISDSPSLQGKATIRLEDFETLSIFQGSLIPTYSADGSLLPLSQWQTGSMIYGWWFDLADVPDWSIGFLSQQDSRSRVALLQMTDTQNQVIISDLLPVPNPLLKTLPITPQTLVDNEFCRIRFTNAWEIQGMHPMLRLRFTCENRDSLPLVVNVRQLLLDSAIIQCSNLYASSVAPGDQESFEVEITREELEQAGVQSVNTLRMHLDVNQNYTVTLFEQSVECSFSADLSGIAAQPLQHDVLATAFWSGLELSLLNVSVEEDKLVTGQLRIRNTTDQPLTVDASYFYLNGLQCRGYLTEQFSKLPLPAGATYHTGMKIQLQGYPNELYRPESLRFLPEALGMAQLSTLGMDVTCGGRSNQTRITFTLPQPTALPVDVSQQQKDAWPVLYAKDGVTIRLADCTWQPDSAYQGSFRYINLLLDNQTSTEVKLSVPTTGPEKQPDCLVNGQPLTFIHTPVIPAETCMMDSLWYTVADPSESLEHIDLLLQITDNQGRLDQVRIQLESTSEAHTEDTYRLLNADQLHITVIPHP